MGGVSLSPFDRVCFGLAEGEGLILFGAARPCRPCGGGRAGFGVLCPAGYGEGFYLKKFLDLHAVSLNLQSPSGLYHHHPLHARPPALSPSLGNGGGVSRRQEEAG